MKRIGFALIIAGFLVAAWVAVQHETAVKWALFIPAAVAAAFGVVIVRSGTRAEMEHADRVQSNIAEIDSSLRAIVTSVGKLNRERETIHTYDMRHRIDELVTADINRFVDARETIGTKYGLHAYADVMSHFAAGERYLNRVWSASADGYIDEVAAYIARAEEQFRETLARFEAVRA